MLTLFMQGALILWLVNAQDPVIFFLYALVWGFGYGGVGTQYGMVSREVFGARLFGPGYAGQNAFAMVGMAVGGFLGGYLYDISHSYATSWLISFASGLISSFIAMDLLSQSERTKAAMAHLRRQGHRVSRHIPYGFTLSEDGSMLTLHPAEQHSLARIRALRLEGLSLRQIAAALTRSKIPTKTSCAWTAKVIHSLLHREVA